MQTLQRVKTSDKVKAALGLGFKKIKLAEHLGITRPMLDSRLKDNCWKLSEIEALKGLGII